MESQDFFKIFFCSTLSEFENFLLCERIMINVNLSKRNVKLILKVLSDLEPLRGSSNKKTLYSTRSCVNWAFFGTRGSLKRSFHSRFKMAHACQKGPIYTSTRQINYYFQHSTTSLNDVPSRKGGTFGTTDICILSVCKYIYLMK
jgi:hypothetical protein